MYFCEHCGALIDADSTFCAHCGHRIESAPTPERPSRSTIPRARRRESPRPLQTITFTSVPVLLVALVAFWFLSRVSTSSREGFEAFLPDTTAAYVEIHDPIGLLVDIEKSSFFKRISASPVWKEAEKSDEGIRQYKDALARAGALRNAVGPIGLALIPTFSADIPLFFVRIQRDYVGTVRASLEAYLDNQKLTYWKHQLKKVRLRHILVRLSAGTDAQQKEKTRARAQAVLEEARAGKNFAQLAKEHSDDPSSAKGGEIGWFSRGELLPDLGAVAFSLKKGEMSQLVESTLGYHILKIEDKKRDRLKYQVEALPGWSFVFTESGLVGSETLVLERYFEWLDKKDRANLLTSTASRRSNTPSLGGNRFGRFYLSSLSLGYILGPPVKNLPGWVSTTDLELSNDGIILKSSSVFTDESPLAKRLLGAFKNPISNRSLKYLPKEVASFITVDLGAVVEIAREFIPWSEMPRKERGLAEELLSTLHGEGLIAVVLDSRGQISEDNVFFAVQQKAPSALIQAVEDRIGGKIGHRRVNRYRDHEISCYQQLFGSRYICYFEIEDFAFLALKQQILRKVADVNDGHVAGFQETIRMDRNLKKVFRRENFGTSYTDLKATVTQDELIHELAGSSPSDQKLLREKLVSISKPSYLVGSTRLRGEIFEGEALLSVDISEFEGLFRVLTQIGGGHVVLLRNRFVTMEAGINGQWAQVENVLQRRSDLIPNLVNTVKGFGVQEREIFTGIAESRAKLAGATTIGDKIKAANSMSSALGRLLVVVERYPDLKSNRNFLALQDELAGTENRLAVERKRYNNRVREYNTQLSGFPENVAAFLIGFRQFPYFEVSVHRNPPRDTRSLYRARSVDAEMKSHLRNAAVAQEAFFVMNNRYTTRVEDLRGYNPTPGVILTIDYADARRFILSARKSSGTVPSWTYDSRTGMVAPGR